MFHCELNYIEFFWGVVKHTRENCNCSCVDLEDTVKAGLNSVSLKHFGVLPIVLIAGLMPISMVSMTSSRYLSRDRKDRIVEKCVRVIFNGKC